MGRSLKSKMGSKSREEQGPSLEDDVKGLDPLLINLPHKHISSLASNFLGTSNSLRTHANGVRHFS